MAAQAAEPIKLGVLEDQSGDFALATIGKVHGIQLATDEINKAGGIAGRQIELVIYDTQSDNTRYQEFMRRVLQRDKVDVVFAGFSSASREAYRPIVDQLERVRLLQQPVRRRRLRRPYDRDRRRSGAAVLDPYPLDDGEVRQAGLHHRRRLQLRPDLGRVGPKHRQGERRRDGRRGVHPARRVAIRLDHPEHPEGQARHPDDPARRYGAVVLLRAGERGQSARSDGQLSQCRPGL